MRRFPLNTAMILTILILAVNNSRADTHVVSLEDIGLGDTGFANDAGNPAGFSSNGARFNNEYDPLWNVWSGWAISNRGDQSTSGYLNQYSSFAGGGVEGPTSNFAMGAPGSQVSPKPSSPGAVINLPTLAWPVSTMHVYLTNSTYAALSMKSGDQFAKKFGGMTGRDPDYFKLVISGYSEEGANGSLLGSIEFYLADYRFDDNSLDYIVQTWKEVDLSSLVLARSLGFELDSSDQSEFSGTRYINTPGYFALDRLTLSGYSVVPEPSSSTLTILGGIPFAITLIRSIRRGVAVRGEAPPAHARSGSPRP